MAMKLGIITSPDEQGFQYVKKFGLDTAEYCINVGTDAKAIDAAQLKALSVQYGVHVASVGRWGSDRLLPDGGINTAEYEQDLALIDLCEALGTPVFVCGCNPIEGIPFEENARYAAAYFTALTDYAAPKNISVAVYNCDWNNMIYDKRGWDIVLPLVPGLGLKYDTSHCINRDGDYLKEMMDYGQYFKHFHVKGTVRVCGHNIPDPPAGLDLTNWGAVMAMLYTHKYKAALSIEPHSTIWQHGSIGDWGVRFTIKMISKYIMPEGAEGDGAILGGPTREEINK